MSNETAPKVTLAKLVEKKQQGEPIVMVTGYDYPSAQAADRAGVDMILVGDSGAQVVLGYDSTVRISVEEMLTFAAAVHRGAKSAFIVSDLPFGSTEESDAQAVRNAVRFIREAGADAVKLEGATPDRLSRIRAIAQAGMAVVGHIGLTPQTSTKLGGFRAQGRTVDTARRLVSDALAVQEAGASVLVIEAVPSEVVAAVLPELRIPVIGIGAGPADGQVLVLHDLLGITQGRAPLFVKRYAQIGQTMTDAIATYSGEVREGSFPGAEHQYRAVAEAVAAAEETVLQLRTDDEE